MEVSSDGGNNFSPTTIAGADNYDTGLDEKDATPALTVSQGRLPSESGVSGDTGITAGQVAVTFDNFGDSSQEIMANTITAGTDNSFGRCDRGTSPSATTDTTIFKTRLISPTPPPWTASTSRSTSSTPRIEYLGLDASLPPAAHRTH